MPNLALHSCREIDATEPYVKYSNGSVLNLALTNYFEIDAQAVVTGLQLCQCSLYSACCIAFHGRV